MRRRLTRQIPEIFQAGVATRREGGSASVWKAIAGTRSRPEIGSSGKSRDSFGSSGESLRPPPIGPREILAAGPHRTPVRQAAIDRASARAETLRAAPEGLRMPRLLLAVALVLLA